MGDTFYVLKLTSNGPTRVDQNAYHDEKEANKHAESFSSRNPGAVFAVVKILDTFVTHFETTSEKV